MGAPSGAPVVARLAGAGQVQILLIFRSMKPNRPRPAPRALHLVPPHVLAETRGGTETAAPMTAACTNPLYTPTIEGGQNALHA